MNRKSFRGFVCLVVMSMMFAFWIGFAWGSYEGMLK